MKKRQQQMRILGVADSALRPGEIGVDLFAGGGGWSEGFQWATGVPPAVAVNHDKHSIEMHTANHPETEHWHEDVFHVDPLKATRGRAVGWLHGSPDCRHFSRAKGSVPNTARALSKKIRGLAWVVVRWAAAVRPRIISLENVSEFLTWGPLHQQGKNAGAPMKRRRGETFRKFVTALESLGYVVDWRELRACDFGAPTSRKRLVLVARCDGQAIRWPEPTHGPGRAHPYRTAAECIDWSIECPSIFERRRPLAEATLRRIAEGIRRFILNNERPFIVNLTHGGRLEDLDAPFRTLTAAHRGEKALVAPTLVQTGYGQRKGQKPRALGIEAPLGTVVAGGSKHALVAAFLAKHFGGVVGQPIARPLSTVTAKDHHALVAATLAKLEDGDGIDGGRAPRDRGGDTSRARGRNGLANLGGEAAPADVAASDREKVGARLPDGSFLASGQTVSRLGSSPCVDGASWSHSGGDGHQPSRREQGEQRSEESGSSDAQREPLSCVQNARPEAFENSGMGGGESGKVAAVLSKYYGSDECGQPLTVPLHTIPTKDRFALVAAFLRRFIPEMAGDVVTVNVGGESFAIVDIGMRMLAPRELARGNGFPDDYILTGTTTQQVARVGNSVPPHFASAIVAANLRDVDEEERAA